MGKYKIVQPCAFLQGGKAIHHTQPGAVVELDDAQAKQLGASVESLSPPEGKVLPPRRKSEPEGNDEQL